MKTKRMRYGKELKYKEKYGIQLLGKNVKVLIQDGLISKINNNEQTWITSIDEVNIFKNLETYLNRLKGGRNENMMKITKFDVASILIKNVKYLFWREKDGLKALDIILNYKKKKPSKPYLEKVGGG